MKIFYFAHVTGTDVGLSGIPRVVRNLARELVGRAEVEFIPVSWSDNLQAIVHAEQKLLDNLSRSNGPELAESSAARSAVEPSPGDWLLVAEVPHLRSYYSDYRSVHLDEVAGYAVEAGFRIALVFHDILPLIFGTGGKLGRPFVELTPGDLRSREDNLERLAFARYAHAAALVDLVLPVSQTAAASLHDWLVRHGHRAERLPPFVPALLPEEVFNEDPTNPSDGAPPGRDPIEFVALGLINAQKNQLAAMTAFLDLVERRPDLDLRLHVIGIVQPEVATAASLLARRARGRIVLHGRLSDGQVRAIVRRAHATVFVSLAEGFGLPVAESLWRGKPCLCSNVGSMAEIASGGGCLAVDPHSIDAIAAGFETLATDTKAYGNLLREISARPLKTWRQYAERIVNALSAVSSGRAPEGENSVGRSTGRRAFDGYGKTALRKPPDCDAILIVAAADWHIPEAFASIGRSRSLYYGGAIHYHAERDAGVAQETLFFGPYISLPPGRYTLKFDGEIEGQLKLALTAHEGKTTILEATVSDFNEPVSFALSGPVENFEITGLRTPQLRSMTLRSAFGEIRGSTLEAVVARVGEKPSVPDAPIRVFEDSGAPLRLPTFFPAAKMRVHDAFGAGQGHRLRDGAAIAFERARHGDVGESTLFFGPYLRLEPGAYSLRLLGELKGSVKLRVTSDFANNLLCEVVLTSFDEPIPVPVRQTVEKVEIIANRLDDTDVMRLEAIEIALAPPATKREEDARQKRSLLARVLRR